MNVTAQHGDSNGFVHRQILKIFNKNATLALMIFGGPVVVQIVQNFCTTVNLVETLAEESCLAKCLDGIKQA